MLLDNLKIGFRHVLKGRLYSLIKISGLALALALLLLPAFNASGRAGKI